MKYYFNARLRKNVYDCSQSWFNHWFLFGLQVCISTWLHIQRLSGACLVLGSILSVTAHINLTKRKCLWTQTLTHTSTARGSVIRPIADGSKHLWCFHMDLILSFLDKISLPHLHLRTFAFLQKTILAFSGLWSWTKLDKNKSCMTRKVLV